VLYCKRFSLPFTSRENWLRLPSPSPSSQTSNTLLTRKAISYVNKDNMQKTRCLMSLPFAQASFAKKFSPKSVPVHVEAGSLAAIQLLLSEAENVEMQV
jgi:hypothetical protein